MSDLVVKIANISIGFASVLLLFNLVSCSPFSLSNQYRVQKDITFKTIDNQNLKMQIYTPQLTGLKPAVLVVHGGGWNKRSGDMESICRRLAKAGFVVFNTTYRLSPKSLFPKPVEDVTDSISWIRQHADDYEVDPNRIAGWGYSAGANLILLAGLDPDRHLKAIVAGGTPADLTAWPDSPLVKNFIGSDLKEGQALWKDASPVNHVSPRSPPVFLYHGEWDELVEIEQMQMMKAALLKKNCEVETYTARWMGHVAVYFLSEESIQRGIDFLKSRLLKDASQYSAASPH